MQTMMKTETGMTGYPSMDMPWLKYYNKESLEKPLPHSTIADYIYTENKDHLTGTALIFFGRKISYGTLFSEIDKAVAAFLACGIKQGDCVSLLTSSCPEATYAMLALNRIGAIANLINPTFTPEQILERLEDTKTTLLIALDKLYQKFSETLAASPVRKTVIMPITRSMPFVTKIIAGKKLKADIAYSDSVITWDDFLRLGREADRNHHVAYAEKMPAIMVYSSGTTGQPKGIVLGNDGINATISLYKTPDFRYGRGDSMLQIIPLWFSTGLVLSFLMPLCCGVSVILEPVYGDENFVKDMVKYVPNIVLAPTSLWLGLISSPKAKNLDLSRMIYPAQGGERVIERTEDAINDFLAAHGCKFKMIKGYGMCELGSTVATETSSYRKYCTAGFPMINVTVSVFDIETNQELKFGQRGEIRAFSPAVMLYYYNREQATADFFVEDAQGRKWGRTGDIGYMDEDGFIFIDGRSTDVFITPAGKRIYNFDVEEVIMHNENIFQCEVIGVPNQNGSELLTAFLILKEGAAASVETIIRDLSDACRAKLGDDSVPKQYKLLDSFAVNISGKRDIDGLRNTKDGFISVK